MKFNIAFLPALISLFSAGVQDSRAAEPTAADYFYRAPVDIASGLSEISRLDMVDYFNHGSSVKNENRLGQKVGLKSLSDEMIVWQDDDSVMTALAVIPAMKGDTVIVVVRTVSTPLADSELTAYDQNWHCLASKILPQPALKDWLTTADRTSVARVEDAVPFMLVTADYDPASKEIILTNRTDAYFAASDTPDALGLLKKELRYRWSGSMFKPVDK